MIVISDNSQSRWKDSLASAPTINLCLLANGEERTQVLTSEGMLAVAGFDPPTVAPSIADNNGGDLTASKYAGYAYVYAATSKYPLVQSSQGAGGDLSPRSNTSPNTVYQYTGGGNRKVIVTVTKTDRTDVDKIWIYRTQLFSSEILAQTAADAGQLFYIGSVLNNGTLGTTTYSDNSLTLSEQIESDNLIAPTAQFACYYDPYFFLFGANEIEVEVDLSVNGIITILNSFDGVWFTGRNGQFVKFKDIDSGGFDNFGTFYFKYLSSTTAQLTSDSDGTTLASAPFTGTTKAKVYGYPSTLHRSKPNNPFAWGETVSIGSAVVARSWVMKVGGGQGIAMSLIPSSSLLKLDLQNPSRSYVFNLKQTQTDAFKATRRLISDTYIPANNYCQFSGLDENKQLQIFALDSRNFCITQTDGGNVFPVSDAVKDELRDIILQTTEHVHFHGFYDPNTELNCFFFREENGLPSPHKMVYNHAPSKQWGTLDCFDILCSAVLPDDYTGQTVVLGGNASGFVGQLLYPNKRVNWIDEPASNDDIYYNGQILFLEDIQQEVQINPILPSDELNGRYFVLTGTFEGLAQYYVFWFQQNGIGNPPVHIVPYTSGTNYELNYVAINYNNGMSLNDIADAIASSISAAEVDSGGYPNFPFTYTTVGGSDEFISVQWKLPVLYSIPLVSYYDLNSGVTFNLNQLSGPYINFDGTPWANGLDADHSDKAIGNWAIIERSMNVNNNGIVWGRISDIRIASEPVNFDVFFDLLYVPSLESFIFGLVDFMGEGPDYGNLNIGVNECRLLKFIDLAEASENKNLTEIWTAASNVRFQTEVVRDKIAVGYHNQLELEPDIYYKLNQDVSIDGTENKDNWFARKDIAISPFKTFGFSLLHRAPTNLKIANITLKM